MKGEAGTALIGVSSCLPDGWIGAGKWKTGLAAAGMRP
jgi:hypothetical protein